MPDTHIHADVSESVPGDALKNTKCVLRSLARFSELDSAITFYIMITPIILSYHSSTRRHLCMANFSARAPAARVLCEIRC